MSCKNCKTSLSETANFCSNCGAKVIRNQLTIKNIAVDVNERFLNYDNKFLKTFIHLFTQPEQVISSYINGTRKRYVDAISYFAIAVTIAGLQMFIISKFFPEAFNFSSFNTKHLQETQQKTMSFVREYQSIIMMFYIPVYALISKLTFYKSKKYNYTGHLVFFMYIQAQTTIMGFLFLVLLVVGVPFMWYSILLTPLIFLYSAYCLKRLYYLTIKQTLYKIIIFTLLFFTFFIIVIIVFSILFYLGGGYDEIIEAAKAKKTLTP